MEIRFSSLWLDPVGVKIKGWIQKSLSPSGKTTVLVVGEAFDQVSIVLFSQLLTWYRVYCCWTGLILLLSLNYQDRRLITRKSHYLQLKTQVKCREFLEWYYFRATEKLKTWLEDASYQKFSLFSDMWSKSSQQETAFQGPATSTPAWGEDSSRSLDCGCSSDLSRVWDLAVALDRRAIDKDVYFSGSFIFSDVYFSRTYIFHDESSSHLCPIWALTSHFLLEENGQTPIPCSAHETKPLLGFQYAVTQWYEILPTVRAVASQSLTNSSLSSGDREKVGVLECLEVQSIHVMERR